MFFSFVTISHFFSSSYLFAIWALPVDLGANSFNRFPNLGYGPNPRCPPRPTRISELLLPPSTGRSCINATLQPNLAAEIAAHIPATPPPITTKSNC